MIRTVMSLATCLVLATAAHANIAAVERRPGTVEAPRFAATNPLVVDDEHLIFNCDDVMETPKCAFEARYRVRNPTDAEVEVVAAFYGIATEEVTVRVDGTDAGVDLSEEDVAALDAAVAAAQGERELPAWLRESVARYGFLARVAPGGTREIVATGYVGAGVRPDVGGGYAVSPVRSRHLLLGDDPTPSVYDVEYLLSPIDTWSDVHALTIIVRYPGDWEFEVGFTGADPDRSHFLPEAPEDAWSVTRGDDGRFEATFEAGEAVPPVLAVTFRTPERVFFQGGPQFALGATVGEGGGEFWMRWTYEVAAPEWLFYSLNMDTNFDDRLVFAPAVVLATPGLVILPSFDAGIGLPIQVMPRTEVGIRLQCGFTWGPVGFVSSFDIYPGLDTGDPDWVQIALMGVLTI